MNVLQIPVMRMLIAQITKVDLLVRVMKDTDQLVENVKVRNQSDNIYIQNGYAE